MSAEQLNILQRQVQQLLIADGQMQKQLNDAQQGQLKAQVVLFSHLCT